jgi:hypothetical protein
MEIVENLAQWQIEYAAWLAQCRQTGQFDWPNYPRPKNNPVSSSPGIDLSKSRLGLISTAGAYLLDSQPPFDAPDPLGDYSLRFFPVTTPFENLAYAHDHYDHTAVNADPQVLLPLRHLANLTHEGVIGQLAPTVISYSGYQPDLTRLVTDLIPPILAAVKSEQLDAPLLIPA